MLNEFKKIKNKINVHNPGYDISWFYNFERDPALSLRTLCLEYYQQNLAKMINKIYSLSSNGQFDSSFLKEMKIEDFLEYNYKYDEDKNEYTFYREDYEEYVISIDYEKIIYEDSNIITLTFDFIESDNKNTIQTGGVGTEESKNNNNDIVTSLYIIVSIIIKLFKVDYITFESHVIKDKAYIIDFNSQNKGNELIHTEIQTYLEGQGINIDDNIINNIISKLKK